MEMRAQATKEKEVMEDLLGLRVAKLENKIAEQNSKMTKHMVEMYEAIHLFSRPSNQADVHHQFRYAPASASFSPAPEFGKRSGNSNTYAGVTRLAKLDFPRFNGDKIKEWLFQVEQFFEIDHTPDELKVRIASDHFDDLAATWHQWMVQSVLWKHVMHDWMTYKMLLQGRFKELEVDPIVELKQLQETDGIRDYHEKFELIKSRVNLSEAYLVSIYLAGLRTDTQENVRMFQPQTIQQCLMLGRLYETAHPTRVIIRKASDDDYQKGAQTLNVSSEAAGPFLSHINVPNALHKDREGFEGKHSIQQATSVGMENFLQQEELNFDKDFVLESDLWFAPYANLETESVNQEKSELCTGNKGEVTFEDFDKADATMNQLLPPIGFVVDDSQSSCRSDIESKDIQQFQIVIEEGNNSYVYQESNGMRLRSHILTQQTKPSKSPKSWKFKFKISKDSKLRYIKFWWEEASSKKKLKYGKFSKFHYKNKFICNMKLFTYKKRQKKWPFMGKAEVDKGIFEDVYVSSFKKSRRCHKGAMVIVDDLSFDLGVTDGYICELDFGQVNYYYREEFVEKLQSELDISVRDEINQSRYLMIYRKEAEEKCYTYLQRANRVWEPGGLPAKATQWDCPKQCYSRLAQKELGETMKNVCGLKVVYVLHWFDRNNWLTNSWCSKSYKDWCFKYKTEMERK